jgi:hypothetical protein
VTRGVEGVKDMFNHQPRESEDLGKVPNRVVRKAIEGEDFSMRLRTIDWFCTRLRGLPHALYSTLARLKIVLLKGLCK